MDDAQRKWLDSRVQELLPLEAELQRALGSAATSARSFTEELLIVSEALPREHANALISYLGERYLPASGVLTDTGAPAAAGEAHRGATRTLPELFALLSHATMSYAALLEAALRLFDLPLREVAWKHQTDYSALLYPVADLLAPAVAAELANSRWECQCECPMCSIGLCGCIAVGQMEAVAPLIPPDQELDSRPGFLIQQPRRGSQLTELHVAAGDVLLTIDGETVNDVAQIQTAIRKHEIGQTMQLVLIHNGAQRELTVTHVHDYQS